jgi:hypothetical protein
MHHYRVDLSGPPAAIAKLLAEIGQETDGSTLFVARDGGVEFWESLSRCHPKVTFGIESFEAFEDELLHALVHNGETTVMAREGLLPSDWGSFHDEDGEPIDDGLLRAAAELVHANRLRYDVGTCATGLATALTMGKALGRLCCRVEGTLYDDASPDALDAVVELAVFALWTSAVGSSKGAAEREYAHACRLTQSMLHAGMSEYRDEPGDAEWDEWLRCLLGSASDIIDAATHVWIEPETDWHAMGAEHHSTPTELLELSARSLLTTCIQALALFSDAHRTAV